MCRGLLRPNIPRYLGLPTTGIRPDERMDSSHSHENQPSLYVRGDVRRHSFRGGLVLQRLAYAGERESCLFVRNCEAPTKYIWYLCPTVADWAYLK